MPYDLEKVWQSVGRKTWDGGLTGWAPDLGRLIRHACMFEWEHDEVKSLIWEAQERKLHGWDLVWRDEPQGEF